MHPSLSLLLANWKPLYRLVFLSFEDIEEKLSRWWLVWWLPPTAIDVQRFINELLTCLPTFHFRLKPIDISHFLPPRIYRMGFKIRLTRLPWLKAILLSFSRLRNIETLSNLFRSVLLLSPGKWYFISPIMHADVATQAAGCQPLYQGDDDEARLHIKVGGWVSSLMCVCVRWCVYEHVPVGFQWGVCEPLFFGCCWVLCGHVFVCVCLCVRVCFCSVSVCLCEFVFTLWVVSVHMFLVLCLIVAVSEFVVPLCVCLWCLFLFVCVCVLFCMWFSVWICACLCVLCDKVCVCVLYF